MDPNIGINFDLPLPISGTTATSRQGHNNGAGLSPPANSCLETR